MKLKRVHLELRFSVFHLDLDLKVIPILQNIVGGGSVLDPGFVMHYLVSI